MIYQQVYDRILALVRGNIGNRDMAEPLSGEFSTADAAKAAFLERYAEAEARALTPAVVLAILQPSLLFCCFQYFLFNAEQRELIVMRQRFLAMQREKNTAQPMPMGFLSGTRVITREQLMPLLLNHMMLETAIAGMHHHIHNCISITGLVVLGLLSEGISPEQIEVFQKLQTKPDETDDDAHAFVVVNRAQNADKNDMGTWGDDCYIIDPWYGYCGKAHDLARDPQRFNRYPLIMSLEDKFPSVCLFSDVEWQGYAARVNAHLPVSAERFCVKPKMS